MINNRDLNKGFFNYACTKCGICKEIFPNKFGNNNSSFYLKDNLSKKQISIFNKFCPGIGFSYSNKRNGKFSNLIGPYFNSYVGHSSNTKIRINSASGGILTEVIIHLIKSKKIDYMLMPIQGNDYNQLPEYKLTRDISHIRRNSQSIYTKIQLKNLIKSSKYKIGFVGLPDQISSIKRLIKHKIIKNNIKFFLGPMVGINMDRDSIDGIKLSYNISKSSKIRRLKWREGKWPGYLSITFDNSKKIKLKKFYYNFLLPFYCSHESLLSVDFSNEDADLSVGDAWSPKYENSNKGGISLIYTKNVRGEKLINELSRLKNIFVKKVSYADAIKMHSHMLDFKKRGSQYRRNIYKFFKLNTPNHKIKKVNFNFLRYLIEIVILMIIYLLRSKIGRLILFILPPNFLGFIFEKLRYLWKRITKNTKRKGLNSY